MRNSELLVKCLEAHQVRYIFGVPGEENEAFLFALENSSITFIPTRHEQGAAFMADVWGRLTGHAGVCLSTLGPGATNLMTGIADANLDFAPLIAITGQGNIDRLHYTSHQVIDVVKMMEPITKWAVSIRKGQTIPSIVNKAFQMAQSGTPGAVHIELPEDVASENSDASLPIVIESPKAFFPDNRLLEKFNHLVDFSKKPLVLIGNGVIRDEASDVLNEWVQKLNLTVANTFMSKGAVSAKSDHHLGTVGLGFEDYIIEAFYESDLVICIGYDIVEYEPKAWNQNRDKRIVHIHNMQPINYQSYNPDLEIIGNIKNVLIALNENFKDGSGFKTWTQQIRNRIKGSINSFDLNDSDKIFTVPGVLNVLRKYIVDDSVLLSDVGSHKMWIARNYETNIANGCIISNGYATMGIALPGAIGAKLAYPQKQVVAVMGDGGAMMNIQELETAKRLSLNITFIVFKDKEYGLIKWKQRMNRKDSFGTRIGDVDFVQLANSFGISAYRPESVGDLKNILGEIQNNEEPCLIEISIENQVNDTLVDTLSNYFKKLS